MNTDTEQDRIAVVIPTRNRASLLAGALTRVAAARRALPPGQQAEIVVVDDGSTDGTPALLAAALRDGQIDRALRNETAQGPASARNRGWRSSRAGLIAFTDDDCEPQDGWLTALATTLRAAPPRIAGVGGRVRPAAPGLVADYMTLHRILEPPDSLAYVVTACCAFRRAALEEVNGFDERVRLAGGEDPGLCLALRARGWRLGPCPNAVVHHHYREGIAEFLRTFYRYGKGCRLVMDR